MQVRVTLLNFTVTPNGLQDQMLGTVVGVENPEMERTKNELLVQSAAMAKQLTDLEADILKLISDAKGDILEDEKLINKLGKSASRRSAKRM